MASENPYSRYSYVKVISMLALGSGHCVSGILIGLAALGSPTVEVVVDDLRHVVLGVPSALHLLLVHDHSHDAEKRFMSITFIA